LKTLTERKENILKVITGEYIARTTSVASEYITRNYGLGISSATIRNEMAQLEEEGYVTRPHPSAGCIPTDKGYRYYVESLEWDKGLPLAEQRLLQRLFQEAERDMEEWLKLATKLLAYLVRNIALVTLPKASECHFKRLEMVELQEFVVLLILILREAKLKQKFLPFEQAIAQEELNAITNKLNATYFGLTRSEISAKARGLSPQEERVTEALLGLMQVEDEHEYEKPYLDGLRHMLSQPEFAQSDRMISLMELLEERSLLKAIVPQGLSQEGLRVIIGEENKEEAMHGCSVVIAEYGIPGEISGAIGVVGPTRMRYGHTISSVHCLSSLLSGMMSQLYGREATNQEVIV
jgi:heat-inducible transcriptional repressor